MDKTEEIIKRRIKHILNNTVGINTRNKKKEDRKIAETLSQEQLKKLRNFKEYYEDLPSNKGGKIKTASIFNILFWIRKLGLYLKKPYEKARKEDIISFFKNLNGTNNVRSISRAKVNIRQFYKWLYNIEEKHKFPEVVDDPRLKPENTRKEPYKKEMKILTKDEILKMINHALNERDRALIMVLFEGGFRSGEIVSMEIRSLVFDNKGCVLYTERSKSDRREVRLIDSEPYLRAWINKHPKKDEPEAPLFCGLKPGVNYGEPLTTYTIRYILIRIGKLAGIKKRVFPHLFRHSAITERGNENFNITLNALRHGITTSTLQNTYLHQSITDSNKAYEESKIEQTDEEKYKLDEERRKTQPKICKRCNLKNEATVLYCARCGLPMSEKAIMKMEEEKKDVNARLDHIESFLKALAHGETSSPETLREAQETIAKISVLGKKKKG